MNRRWKKVAVLLLKIVILVGIIEYARKQSQLGDAIAVSHGRGAVLTGVDGLVIELAPGTRLKVVDQEGAAKNKSLGYRVVTPDGRLAEIAANDVEGSPSAPQGHD